MYNYHFFCFKLLNCSPDAIVNYDSAQIERYLSVRGPGDFYIEH